jgi:hypothetical protein
MIGFAAFSLMAETTVILIKSLYGRNLRARYPTFPVATALEQPSCINGAKYTTIIYNPANAYTQAHKSFDQTGCLVWAIYLGLNSQENNTLRCDRGQ